MKKLTAAIILNLVLLFSVIGFAHGNALTLNAENGRILAPAGLGFEMNGQFSKYQEINPSTMDYQARLSYGIRPAITISGEFNSSFQKDSPSQTMIKVLFSPTQGGNGYTLYADYDLGRSSFADYGISLWYDSKYLFTFVNLDVPATPNKPSSLVITPGANLRVGSKLRIGGEMEILADSWKNQELRFGINYNLTSKIAGKIGFATTMNNQPDRVYQTGVSVEI